MAAGDLALSLLLTATDLASVVVADMATSYIGSTVAMTDSTVLLSDSTVALADSVASSLVPALVDADGNIVAMNMAMADTDTTLLGASASIDSMVASLAAANPALDATAVSADASATSLAATATSADAAAASLTATATAASRESESVDIASIATGGLSKVLDVVKKGAEFTVIGLLAVTAASVYMASNFQASMTSLVTGAGESEKNIKMVSDGILKMAVVTGTSTKELADGMYMIESAGFHGAAGLKVLQAAAEGAKVGNASLADVANGVTTIMVDYAKSGITAAQATNMLVTAVSLGKTHMTDLANAMSTVLPTAAAVGVKVGDVSAAMATMTGEGTDAASAATYLKQMLIALESPSSKGAKALAAVGLTAGEVSSEMRKSLPDTLAMITEALDKKFPAATATAVAEFKKVQSGSESLDQALSNLSTTTSPAYVAALKDISGGSRQMQGMLELTGSHLQTFQSNLEGVTKAVNGGGDAIIGWNLVQQDFNTKVDQAKQVVETLMIKIGTALLPVLSQLFDDIGPVVQSFSDWVDKSQVLQGVAQTLTGWLGYVKDGFNQANTAVAPFKETIAHFTTAYGDALSQIEQTSTAIAPLKDAFGQTMNNLQQLGNTVKPVEGNFGQFLNTLEQSGKAAAPLTDTFDRANGILSKTHGVVGAQPNVWVPFWKEILHVKDQIMAIDWGAVWKGIQEIGGAISKMDWGKVGAFFSNVATNIGKMDWGKFSKAFEGAILSLTKVDWGKVEEGASKVFGAMIGVDWNKIGSDLPKAIDALSKVDWGELGKEIGQVTSGIQQMQATFDWFGTWVGGGWLANVITGIIKWFQWLYNTLIGHSIIPDLINGMVKWFTDLGPRAMAGITSFITNAKNTLSQFATDAVQLGSNIVQGIANGISGAFGFIGTSMSNLVSYIGSFLPHSPARQGELSHLNEYGPSFVKGFADGITRSHPMMHTALSGLTSIMAAPGSFAAGSASGGNAFALSGGQTIMVQVQPQKQDIYLDRKKVGEGVMQYAQQEIRISGNVRR